MGMGVPGISLNKIHLICITLLVHALLSKADIRKLLNLFDPIAIVVAMSLFEIMTRLGESHLQQQICPSDTKLRYVSEVLAKHRSQKL